MSSFAKIFIVSSKREGLDVARAKKFDFCCTVFVNVLRIF